MERLRECQKTAIKELENIPNMTDRELLESIAEVLVIMELKEKEWEEQKKMMTINITI